jgi:hypothetical protein
VATDFFTTDGSNRCGLAWLVILGFMKLSIRRVDIAGTTCGTDRRSMTQIARKVTDNMEELGKGKRDHIAEEPPRPLCHYPFDRNEPGVENGLIVPFAASNPKASRVKRNQRRDRLLNHDQCEAA